MVQNGPEFDPKVIWFWFRAPCFKRPPWEPDRNNGLSCMELVWEVGDACSSFRLLSINHCISTSKRVPSQSRVSRFQPICMVRRSKWWRSGTQGRHGNKNMKNLQFIYHLMCGQTNATYHSPHKHYRPKNILGELISVKITA